MSPAGWTVRSFLPQALGVRWNAEIRAPLLAGIFESGGRDAIRSLRPINITVPVNARLCCTNQTPT